MSIARNPIGTLGTQGMASSRSYTIVAILITSSAVASVFSTINKVQSLSSFALSPKIHYMAKRLESIVKEVRAIGKGGEKEGKRRGRKGRRKEGEAAVFN
jgi:hypothetical protein